jgi:hypothetical protein
LFCSNLIFSDFSKTRRKKHLLRHVLTVACPDGKKWERLNEKKRKIEKVAVTILTDNFYLKVFCFYLLSVERGQSQRLNFEIECAIEIQTLNELEGSEGENNVDFVVYLL